LTRDWGHPHRRGPSLHLFGAALGLLVVLAVVVAGVQIVVRSVPPVHYLATAPASFTVPGPAPGLPFPARGEATVAVLGVGTMGSSGGDAPVPIASLTKMMTADVVLADHPLAPGEQGPLITVPAAAVAAEAVDAAGGQSVVKVAAGEQLSEMQALEALLVGSANNIGNLLAGWDAGSIPSFVARMNARAKNLGMTATHYTDATGIQASSVSSASDQVRLAEAAMNNRVFAGIVALPEINLPVAGTVFNFDYLVGHDGVIGIKTGSTARAGGCFVFAAIRSEGGVPVAIIGAVLGQHGPSILQAALSASLNLINAAGAAVRPVTVSVPGNGVVGQLNAPWAQPDPVVARGSWTTVGWGGLRIDLHLPSSRLPAHIEAGTRLGTVTLGLGSQSHQLPVTVSRAFPGPSLRWRLERS
jgi:serine-type D-Ala-D-Ala carboxypeptidase (penicillin-binding protein 5/6)